LRHRYADDVDHQDRPRAQLVIVGPQVVGEALGF